MPPINTGYVVSRVTRPNKPEYRLTATVLQYLKLAGYLVTGVLCTCAALMRSVGLPFYTCFIVCFSVSVSMLQAGYTPTSAASEHDLTGPASSEASLSYSDKTMRLGALYGLYTFYMTQPAQLHKISHIPVPLGGSSCHNILFSVSILITAPSSSLPPNNARRMPILGGGK